MRLFYPFAILIGLTAGTLVAASSSKSAPPPQDPEPRVIEVVAKGFTFEPSQIDVTEGERIRMVVKSGDGFHGFGIKKFNISKEVPRGETVTIEFTANAAGEFPILCTVFCGDGHEEMKGLLVVKARPQAP